MQIDIKIINDAIICDEKTIIFILRIGSNERTIIFVFWSIWFCRNQTTKWFFSHNLIYLSNTRKLSYQGKNIASKS